MPVQSIECQLTQAQMKRYLAGVDFSDEIVSSLERHLKVCPDCKAEANRQREALGGAPAEVVQAVVGGRPKPSPLHAVKALVSRAAPAPTPPQGLIVPKGQKPTVADPIGVIKTPKNLILSGALAVVLVLMSTVFKNPSRFFGPPASAKLAAAPADEESAKQDSTEQHDPEKPAHETAEHGASEKPAGATEAGHESTEKTAEPAAAEKVDPHGHAAAKPTDSKPQGHETPVHKPPVEKVGGQVVIADSTKPPVVKKPPATTKKPVATHRSSSRKPAAKPKAVRKRTPQSKRPISRIKVYKPE